MVARASLEEQIRESLTPCLEAGEQLRAVGAFQSGGMWAELPKATFFTIRNWWVGITDQRLILAKQSRVNGKIIENAIFSVALDDVGIVRGALLTLRIASPDPKVPKRLRSLKVGGPKDEFKKALSSS